MRYEKRGGSRSYVISKGRTVKATGPSLLQQEARGTVRPERQGSKLKQGGRKGRRFGIAGKASKGTVPSDVVTLRLRCRVPQKVATDLSNCAARDLLTKVLRGKHKTNRMPGGWSLRSSCVSSPRVRLLVRGSFDQCESWNRLGAHSLSRNTWN
jgi:hypothetical protein